MEIQNNQELENRTHLSGKLASYSPVPVHQLIEKHALTSPTTVAAYLEDKKIDYRTLNANANQLIISQQKVFNHKIELPFC